MCIAEQQQGTTTGVVSPQVGDACCGDAHTTPDGATQASKHRPASPQSTWNARQLQLMRHMQGIQAARAAQRAHSAAVHTHLVRQWQAAGTGPLWDPEDLEWCSFGDILFFCTQDMGHVAFFSSRPTGVQFPNLKLSGGARTQPRAQNCTQPSWTCRVQLETSCAHSVQGSMCLTQHHGCYLYQMLLLVGEISVC